MNSGRSRIQGRASVATPQRRGLQGPGCTQPTPWKKEENHHTILTTTESWGGYLCSKTKEHKDGCTNSISVNLALPQFIIRIILDQNHFGYPREKAISDNLQRMKGRYSFSRPETFSFWTCNSKSVCIMCYNSLWGWRSARVAKREHKPNVRHMVSHYRL